MKAQDENRVSLEQQVDEITWEILKPHIEKGDFFVVGQELDFLGTAVAIAEDDAEKVKVWIELGHLTRPAPESLNSWSLVAGKKFKFVIVKPFLLIQEIFAS